MASSANAGGRHPELVESPRERRPFAQLQPMRDGGLTAEAARGLPRLRLRVEPQIPSIVRGLVALAAHPTSVTEDAAAQIGALNRRRRAATEWLRAILDGAVDLSTQRDVAEVWLPALIGGQSNAVQERAQMVVEYVRGVLTGLVMARPEDNLVPEARSLFAIDTVLALHLGAVLGRGLPATAPTPARTRSTTDTKVGV